MEQSKAYSARENPNRKKLTHAPALLPPLLPLYLQNSKEQLLP